MTSMAQDSFAMVARLEAMLGQPDIPPKAATACQSLIERMQRPITVGIVGLAGGQKRAVLNALAGDRLLAADVLWPTLDIHYGATSTVSAMLGDGTTLRHDGLPDPAMLAQGPVFLRIAAPQEALRHMNLLDIVGDATAEEWPAALAWGAKRCDIVLWSTLSWTPWEQEIWKNAPDEMKNHAILLAMSSPAPLRVDPAHGFETVLDLGQSAAEASAYDKLIACVQGVIDAALAEDLDAGLMFLQRFSRAGTAEVPGVETVPAPEPVVSASEEPPAVTVPELPSATAPRVVPFPAASVPKPPPEAPSKAPVRPAAEIPREAFGALSRALHHIRSNCAALLDALDGDDLTPDMAADLMDQLEELVMSLVAHSEFHQEIGETWPHLQDAICDANELMLLMKIESGEEQICEAAALLLQLRREFEHELAA